MFDRECQRIRNGNARMVPKLREAHIIRDSWIKLNVAPAKIMQVRCFHVCEIIHLEHPQQEQVLSELFQYVKQQPLPVDAAQVECTLKYLEACSKIFENGLLSHNRVIDTNSNILKNIREGYDFFVAGTLPFQKQPLQVRALVKYRLVLLSPFNRISWARALNTD